MQPPDGPPVCDGLEACRRRDAAADSRRSRTGVPIGTSMSPVIAILPASGEDLRPLDFSRADAENQSPPRVMMGGMLAKVSTLLISVGLPHRPFSGG